MSTTVRSSSTTTRSTSTTTAAAPKPAAARRVATSSADSVDRAPARAQERAAIRDTARAARTPPRATTAERASGRPLPVERERPSVQAAMDARAKVDAAQTRLGGLGMTRVVGALEDVLGAQGPTPAQEKALDGSIATAEKDLKAAQDVAQKLGDKAMREVQAPVREALQESARAQHEAARANEAVDAAQRAVVGLNQQKHMILREEPGADMSAIDARIAEAQHRVGPLAEQAEAASTRAVEAGDRAIAAQQEANRVAGKLGRPVPYPSAEGVRGTEGATQLDETAQREVLGAPAGVSTHQASEVRVDRMADHARASVEKSGEAHARAHAAKAELENAQKALAEAQTRRAEAVNATPARQLDAQRSVDVAQAAVRTAESKLHKAETAARTLGDEAIAAQERANRVADETGHVTPFPDAVGLRDTLDAASLPEDVQKRVLGGASTITKLEAVDADIAAMRVGSPEQRANTLRDQLHRPMPPDVREEFIRRAGPEVERMASEVTTSDPRGRDAEMNRVANAMAGALREAGPDADALQQAWARGASTGTMGADELQGILANDDPVRRNEAITRGYHDLSNQTADLIGRDNANWLTFGQYASSSAGRGIRGDLGMSGFEDAGAGLAGVDRKQVMDALGDGNRKIFGDIAPSFQQFNETFRNDPRWRTDPAHGEQMLSDFQQRIPEGLRPAFRDYYDAMRLNAGPHTAETDRERAQLVYRANVRVAEHEQKIAQDDVARAIPNGNVVGDVGSWVMGSGSVEERATDRIQLVVGDEHIHVSRDVKRPYPRDLEHLDDPDGYHADRARQWTGDDVDDRSHSDANNWQSYDDRMGFISHMFRAYQQGVDGIFDGPPEVRGA